MSGNFKWFSKEEHDSDAKYYVVLFVSRNKDNKDIPNYRERRRSYFRYKDMEKLKRDFAHFVSDGVPGEFCRMYISLNARDTAKVKKCLLHTLIDKDSINFENLGAIVCGIAAEKTNALEHKWFFDFDRDNELDMREFCNDIKDIDSSLMPEVVKTPHGYAVIVQHGFDVRDLLAKYPDVGLKKDDLICYDWSVKE